MPPIVKQTLKEIGLSEKESLVLSALLENESLPASSIAKLSNLNRTTAYGILKNLAGKGLTSSIKKSGTTRYQSIAPELLPGYIEKRREILAESAEEIRKSLPQLKLLRTKGGVLPKVQFFEGKEGVEQAYEDTISNNKDKIIYALTGLETAYAKFDRKFLDYYVTKRTRLGIKAFYIVPGTEAARKNTLEDEKIIRYAKFIPPKFNFDSEIVIYDNKVAMISYLPEDPVALIIEDETITRTIKQIFNYIDSTATK